MNDATLLGLKPRAFEIFNALVTAYLGSGQPIGSKTLAKRLRHELSPASIRSNMSDLEQAGLLYAPHTSAGRVPTETGLRMFVDGLMEYSPDLVTEDRMSIDGECAVRNISVDELLEKTSRTLSGLSRCASLVLSPASNAELQHFEFVPLGENRALAVLVRMDGKVENRLIDLPPGVPQSALVRASNYMNARLSGRDLTGATGLIRTEIAAQRAFDKLRGPEVVPGPDATSDDDLDAFVRANANSAYHVCGTCKIGQDEMAVVAPDLRVHGIDGLRVVDASITPSITNGNTNAPSLMIGEKGASMILKTRRGRNAA